METEYKGKHMDLVQPLPIFPGVWKLRFGTPETQVPTAQRYRFAPLSEKLAEMGDAAFPFSPEEIRFSRSSRGCRLELPLRQDEDVYGFGLQLKRLCHTGKKVALRVNSDPAAATGDSHAPAPLYFSTAGYGVFLDTARYAVFYCGGSAKRSDSREEKTRGIQLDEASLYRAGEKIKGPVIADIPASRGIDLYVFSGPDLAAALKRYILFSGGGAWIPEWGIGVCYRTCADFSEDEVLSLAALLRRFRIPCDVLGLEPGWQTHAYSCSLQWNRERFPEPEAFCAKLRSAGYRINLWEHVFLHPTSPLYRTLEKGSGDFRVWDGLVPDLSLPRVEEKFRNHHKNELIKSGVSSFKLDECDNSDFICTPWSFPNCARFPSGKDGETMHSMLGNLYMDSVRRACEDAGFRTCGYVRSEHALASPQPYFLYSDLYDHREFIRGVSSAGFSGMLWAPEIRGAVSDEDYQRRLQSAVLSPQVLLNIWRMPHPPWMQYDTEKNRRGEFFSQRHQRKLLRITRECLSWRMRFLPYLFAAFAEYRFSGEVPFRAPVVDDPANPALREVDDAWLVGRSLYVCPFVAGEKRKKVIFPAGRWRDFHTGAIYEGEADIVPTDDLPPLFVRENSVIPLGDVVPHTHDGRQNLTLRVYGTNPIPAHLFGDDGGSLELSEKNYGAVYPDGSLDPTLREKYHVEKVEIIG